MRLGGCALPNESLRIRQALTHGRELPRVDLQILRIYAQLRTEALDVASQEQRLSLGFGRFELRRAVFQLVRIGVVIRLFIGL